MKAKAPVFRDEFYKNLAKIIVAGKGRINYNCEIKRGQLVLTLTWDDLLPSSVPHLENFQIREKCLMAFEEEFAAGSNVLKMCASKNTVAYYANIK